MSGGAACNDAAAGPRRGPDWLVPAILGSALLVQTLSGMAVATALPAMGKALNEDPVHLNLTITLFMLSQATFTPVSGWLADKYGARRIFLISMVLFALASALCGFAQDLWQLLGARVLQGAAGAMMLPVGRLVILRTTPRDQILTAMTVLTTPLFLGPLLGPLIGGALVTFANWRWIFFMNLPLAMVGLVLISAYVPDLREDRPPRLDVIGVILTGLGMAGMIFGFENLGGHLLSVWMAPAFFLGGAAALGLYWLHARRREEPVIDLTIFRAPTYAASVIGGSFLRLGIGMSPFLMALFFQIGLGMSAFTAGVIMFFASASGFVMRNMAPMVVRAIGFKRVLVWNTVIVALSHIVFAFFHATTPVWLMVALISVIGFFRALQFTVMNSLAYSEMEHAKMSAASTTAGMMQQLNNSLGVGLAALCVQWLTRWKGEPQLSAETVATVLVVLGLTAGLSLFWFVRLPADAGENIAGPRRRF